MTRKLSAVVIGAAITIGACSGGGAPKEQASQAGAPNGDIATTTVPGGAQTPSTADTAGGNKPPQSSGQTGARSQLSQTSAGLGSTTTSTTAFVRRQGGHLPYELTVTPRCVERGQTLDIVLLTQNNASIAGAVAFSDSGAHGLFIVGNANSDGRWTWSPVIPPTAPDGQAYVLISAQDRSPDSNEEGAETNGDSASSTEPFEVKAKC